jgi:hypothetical protein
MGGRWTRVMAVVLGGAALLAFAGVAAGLTGSSKSITILPQHSGTVTAKCDAGSVVVSGGFAAPGFDPTGGTGPAILTSSSALAGTGKWLASGYNFSDPTHPKGVVPGSGPLFSYAYCDKRDPSVTVLSDVAIVPPGGHATLAPSCQSQREAVSGGFVADPPDTNGFTDYAYTSMRSGERAWKVGVLNPDMTTKHRVRAIVYCEKKGPKLVTRSASETVSIARPLKTATLSAKCPSGKKPFSGGYESTITQSSRGVQAGLAFTSRRAAHRSWQVSAAPVVVQGQAPKETAFVYCTG